MMFSNNALKKVAISSGAAFALLFSCVVFSEDTPKLSVVSLNSWSGTTVISIASDYSSAQNCSSSSSRKFIIRNADQPEKQTMLSTLLAAGVSGKPLSFRLIGCGGGNYDYPLVERVQIFF